MVAALTKLRPPLKVDTATFSVAIDQAAGMPYNVTPEGAVIAVFSIMRSLLIAERLKEISSFLPDGLKVMWEQI